MKIIFLGATQYSLEMLESLITQGFKPSVIFGISKKFKISYASEGVINFNYGNLELLAKMEAIEYHEINGEIGKKFEDFYEVIKNHKPDLILVIGWYYMVKRKIRELARFGAWGVHASLLPDYAGGSPLVWAMINGETKTGVTLFQLDDGVDTGDIIDQKAFTIKSNDTIKSVYRKATEVSKIIVSDALRSVEKLSLKKQDPLKRREFPQRKPVDGEIDLNWPAKQILNFIRAQSSPYPGAFVIGGDGKKIFIEEARLASED